MHTPYREISWEDACRLLDYCHRNTIHNGGLFEVYTTPGTDIHMIIVNACPEDGPADRFRPLGAFYLNYLKPGCISLEHEDPTENRPPEARRHVAAIKQVIDLLLTEARPGVTIRFNDLPAVRAVQDRG